MQGIPASEGRLPLRGGRHDERDISVHLRVHLRVHQRRGRRSERGMPVHIHDGYMIRVRYIRFLQPTSLPFFIISLLRGSVALGRIIMGYGLARARRGARRARAQRPAWSDTPSPPAARTALPRVSSRCVPLSPVRAHLTTRVAPGRLPAASPVRPGCQRRREIVTRREALDGRGPARAGKTCLGRSRVEKRRFHDHDT